MTTQTIEALGRLRLEGMIDALEQQSRSSEFLTLGFDERLSHLVTAEKANCSDNGFCRTPQVQRDS
jgi:hypothetical protein